MRIPKQFLGFVAIAQIFLFLYHWVVFVLLLSFFPALAIHQTTFALVVLILSILPLSTGVLDYMYDGPILRVLYVTSWVWLVYSMYLAIASIICLFAYRIWGVNLENFGLLAITLSAAMTLYGIINARVIRVIKINVSLPNLPTAWSGKTAVLLSDIHLGHVLRHGFAKKVVRTIKALQPEIVFIPGDFYDGVHTTFAELAAEFRYINAPSGTYFCSGNHEMFAGYSNCEQAIKKAGIKILEDEKVEVNGLQIAGLAYKNETDKTVAERLRTMQIDPNRPSILLKHVPTHLSAIERAGVSLEVSGHTHLGQVWPFRYVTHRAFKGFDYGLKKLGRMHIYTSSGVGTWGPPMRVFTKSEIIQITFQ